ncbi:acyl-homoserine-lactone synthase [Methylobacterium oryzihabitans]|uniref:Acyl-homoserine-lactone synthase n=1 Tax=Methylobacterium oryzihabitans TaxID=2499852 RepID=A0A3S2VKD2_9HYPH|nr:acyl-homoserine-lactone synthase [Methylobacterium oryzihabitans]RVU14860.1 GNAT family N-acetyltransferase [Methylobacterium oryzihabitans]
MIQMIEGRYGRHHADLMERVFRFRHRFFVDHLKWEALRRPDGREIDAFDGPDCVHLVGLDGDEVVSYARLLATTRPHLQSHVYPQILQGAVAPTGPHIYEWTRCAAAPWKRDGTRALDPISGYQFAAVAEAAERLGLDGLLVQTHPIIVERLISIGWDVEPLALPFPYDGKPLMPIYARLTPDTAATTLAVYGLAGPALEAPAERPGEGPAPWAPADR